MAMRPKNSAAAWPAQDIVMPGFSMPGFIGQVSLAALLDFSYERHPMIARSRDAAHHPHHRAVSDSPVAANIDEIVAAAVARVNDRFEFRQQVIDLDLVVL